MENNYCIIMAGGIGSRFWPLSTTNTPKQFLDILGIGKSLLRLTFERMLKVCPAENFFIVTNEIYEELVLTQLPEISSHQVLKEPLRRNTAPCIAYGNHEIRKINPNANIIVTPADHIILHEDQFVSVINSGLSFISNNDVLLTLGIKPSRPDTGYGYIQVGKKIDNSNEHVINKVKTFTEKPDLELAKVFVNSGDFFWNSGIFLWSLSSIDSAFKNFLPKVFELFEEQLQDNNENIDDVYSKCQNISIDYGVMEKSDNVYVLQSDFGWSDLGTWGALYDLTEKDSLKNSCIGKNIMLYETSECMISIPDNKLAVIDGLHDFIVIDSGESLLICKRSDEQRIRQFVNDIKIKKGETFI